MKNTWTRGGRSFEFKIPNAKQGAAIFNMMCSFKIPFGADIMIGIKAKEQSMNADELSEFMTLCLQNCLEKLPEGHKAPVIDDEGLPGVMDLSPKLQVQICVQYMLFFVDYWLGEGSSTSEFTPPVSPPPVQLTSPRRSTPQ